MADWMQLSTDNHNKLYEEFGKFRNGRKMLGLVNRVVYSNPIGNGEEGEWSGQCDDTGTMLRVYKRTGKSSSWDQ